MAVTTHLRIAQRFDTGTTVDGLPGNPSTDSSVNQGADGNVYLPDGTLVEPNLPITDTGQIDYGPGDHTGDGGGPRPGDPTKPPPPHGATGDAPSVPILDTSTFLKTIRAKWDGMLADGTKVPMDFVRCECHYSTDNGFQPNQATLVDSLTTLGGVVDITGLDPGRTYYVRFVLVFQTSWVPPKFLYSNPSDVASGQPGGVSTADINPQAITSALIASGAINSGLIADNAIVAQKIAAGAVGATQIASAAVGTAQIQAAAITNALIGQAAVGTAQIIDGAIQNAKIADATINDAKIGSVSAGKITAGNINADLTVSARIKTADTGARCELNATGVKVYDAYGNLVADLNSNGTATYRGVIKAAYYESSPPGSAGNSAITIKDTNSASVPDAITFYPPSSATPSGYIYPYSDSRGTGIQINSTYPVVGRDGNATLLVQGSMVRRTTNAVHSWMATSTAATGDGTYTTDANSAVTINFPQAFASSAVPFVAAWARNGSTPRPCWVTAVSTSQFTVQVGTGTGNLGSGNACYITWMAWGMTG